MSPDRVERLSIIRDAREFWFFKFYIAKYSLVSNQHPIEEYTTAKSNPTNHYRFTIQPADQSRINSIYEVSIPTCSYRMGTKDMGYGMITISRTGHVQLSILWLPSRFHSLFLYLGLLGFSFTFGSIFYCFKNISVSTKALKTNKNLIYKQGTNKLL